MNIAHVLGSVNRGGAEILVFDIIKSNCSKNTYHLIHFRTGTLEPELKKLDNVKYIPRKSFSLKFLIDFRKYLKQHNIRTVHIHEPIYCIYAFIASLGMSVNLFLTIHGFWKSYLNRIIILIASIISKKTFFVSGAFIKRFEAESNMKIKNAAILFNGINVDKFKHGKSKLKQELKLEPDTIIFGMIGNFYTNVRDHITVCKAFENISKSHNNIILVFAGGFYSNSIGYQECYSFCKSKNLLGKIQFLGYRTDIEDILESIDLFVYASNKDTFGIAIVEAMIYGKPILINDLDVFMEVSDNGKYATTYITRDIFDFSKKLEDFIINPKKLYSTALQAKKWASQKYSIEKHIHLLEKFYEI